MNMKEKLNLRNAIIWTAALIALILFFCSFGAKASFSGNMEGEYISMTCSSVVWGCRSVFGFANGKSTAEILNSPVANAPGIIGALFLFLASGGVVVISLLLKNEKLAKILAFVCAGVMLVAGILLFFVSEAPWYCVQELLFEEARVKLDIETLKEVYAGFKTSSSYAVVGGIFAILAAGGVVASQFIPNVQFIKPKAEEAQAE